MLTLERRRERAGLVDAVRHVCLDADARAALADWEEEYGSPRYGEFLRASYLDLFSLAHGGILRGPLFWDVSLWEHAVPAPCYRHHAAFGSREATFIAGANAGNDASRLPRGCALLAAVTRISDSTLRGQNAGLEESVRGFTCGGLLTELYCPAFAWESYGADVVEKTPVAYVRPGFYRPAAVRPKRGGRVARYAWFNGDVPHDGRFVHRPYDPSRIPFAVFRHLPGNDNPRVARYDEEADAVIALSAALIAWACGVRDERLQRVHGSEEAGRQHP